MSIPKLITGQEMDIKGMLAVDTIESLEKIIRSSKSVAVMENITSTEAQWEM